MQSKIFGLMTKIKVGLRFLCIASWLSWQKADPTLDYIASTILSAIVGLMLGYHLLRCINNNPTLAESIVFAGYTPSYRTVLWLLYILQGQAKNAVSAYYTSKQIGLLPFGFAWQYSSYCCELLSFCWSSPHSTDRDEFLWKTSW